MRISNSLSTYSTDKQRNNKKQISTFLLIEMFNFLLFWKTFSKELSGRKTEIIREYNIENIIDKKDFLMNTNSYTKIRN
jgi:hypothetical protein